MTVRYDVVVVMPHLHDPESIRNILRIPLKETVVLDTRQGYGRFFMMKKTTVVSNFFLGGTTPFTTKI